MLRGRCCKKNGTTKRERNKTTAQCPTQELMKKKEGEKGRRRRRRKKKTREISYSWVKMVWLLIEGIKGKRRRRGREAEGRGGCWATGASGMAFVWILERLSCLIRYGLEIRPPRADSGEGSSYKTG